MATSRLTRLAGALAAAALVVLAAPAHAQMQTYGDAALVNGDPISIERLERNFDEYLREKQMNLVSMRSPQRAARMKREVLDLLVDQELLLQEAKRRQIQVSEKEAQAAVEAVRKTFTKPELFDQRLVRENFTLETYTAHVRRMLSARKVLEQVSASVTVSDQAVADFMKEHAGEFVAPEERRLRHLYLPFAPGLDDVARGEARQRMAGLQKQAREGGDFAKLAREHSRGSSADRGGDIGYVQRHELAQPLAEAAFKIPVGDVSDVVELPDGLHLLKVDDVKLSAPMPEAAAKERVRGYLLAKAGEEARAGLVKTLRADARIQVLIPLPSPSVEAPDELSPTQRARRAMP